MKEKLDKKMIFGVQKSLYNNFKESCDKEYKTMSEVVRDFMVKYIKEHKK